MNDSYQLDGTVWLVADENGAMRVFADRFSGFEFCHLRANAGEFWRDPIEYEVGHYGRVSANAVSAVARQPETE